MMRRVPVHSFTCVACLSHGWMDGWTRERERESVCARVWCGGVVFSSRAVCPSARASAFKQHAPLHTHNSERERERHRGRCVIVSSHWGDRDAAKCIWWFFLLTHKETLDRSIVGCDDPPTMTARETERQTDRRSLVPLRAWHGTNIAETTREESEERTDRQTDRQTGQLLTPWMDGWKGAAVFGEPFSSVHSSSLYVTLLAAELFESTTPVHRYTN